MIRINGINKYYGNRFQRVHVLTDINLEVNTGSFTVIVGRSGSGKTTLLNIVGGLDRPDSGEVLIHDVALYDMKNHERTIFRRRHIGYVFQSFQLIPDLTVYDNICLPLRLDKQKPDEEYIQELMKRMGIISLAERYPEQLSGGEQQRTAVARALAMKPDLILADEPTGNLDKKTSEELFDLLLEVRRTYNQTILMVTHDLEIARRADCLITIEDGRIIGDTREEVFRHEG